jgi:hypothetical protein
VSGNSSKINAYNTALQQAYRTQARNELLGQANNWFNSLNQQGNGYQVQQPNLQRAEIPTGPAVSDQSMQQQINLDRAHNTRDAASDISGIQSSAAGRGFGANSPLMQALMANRGAQASAQSASDEANIRYKTGQLNADQSNKTAALRNQQENEQQQLGLGYENARVTNAGNQKQYQAHLLNSLFGLYGGLM